MIPQNSRTRKRVDKLKRLFYNDSNLRGEVRSLAQSQFRLRRVQFQTGGRVLRRRRAPSPRANRPIR